MMARLSATIIMLFLAFAAGYWGESVVFGLMFLFFAAVTWSKWEIISGAFAAARRESQTPIIRLSSSIIGGLANMLRGNRLHRRSPSSSDA
ncbi:MAG TPA: hypothetical protein VFX06_02990 [Stellaceae bacterium]|nr:hypothetical protein [Stellaceae bacterium]